MAPILRDKEHTFAGGIFCHPSFCQKRVLANKLWAKKCGDRRCSFCPDIEKIQIRRATKPAYFRHFSFLSATNSATAFEDLWLMTAAESLVIANSTFSWWGAYLAERQDRTVYAPKSWFHPNTLNDQYLNCHDWHLVGEPTSHRKAD